MAIGTSVDVVMPQMGVSVSEGTVTKWLKSEGEPVAADEPLLEISTDKVDTEVPSPAAGLLGQILVQEGETVAVGTPIATIVPEGAASPASTPGTQPDQAEPPPPPSEEAPEPATQDAAAETAAASSAEGGPPAFGTEIVGEKPSPPPVAESEEDGSGESRAFVSPVVGRIAAEHGVDVSRIPGTGRGGRVTKKDILAYLEEAGSEPSETPAESAQPAPAAPARATPPPPPPAPTPAPPSGQPPAAAEAIPGETVEPMTVMRKAIAEHMVRSVQTSAHVTTIFEIDMAKIVAIRNGLKEEYDTKHGVRLTYLPFICRAVVDALTKWPRMNGEIRDDQIVTKSFVNLGIAVALDDGKGLIVPVIQNAEEKNLLGMARAIGDLAERARTKRLLPDDVQGGTFTITNPGGFGAIGGTPIINQPQVGIIDVEAIVKRPVVVTDEHGNDSIAIRPMMNLCLSYDHRLVDGAYAAPFMRDVKTSLETWDDSAY
jgi:pyruvate dehydrogenase E2 component (dihydrolipoamide acetyltransferase)